MNYTLNVDTDGNSLAKLYSHGGTLQLSNGYNRIVTGNRGPYVEFTEDQLILTAFHIPKDQLYRLTDKRVYYVEFRSIDDYVTLYYQLQTVAYKDYKIGMFYASPCELFSSTGECMATFKFDVVQVQENKFFT